MRRHLLTPAVLTAGLTVAVAATAAVTTTARPAAAAATAAAGAHRAVKRVFLVTGEQVTAGAAGSAGVSVRAGVPGGNGGLRARCRC